MSNFCYLIFNDSETVLQMRKFAAQYSAGLRIRVNPSLQSEYIGVILPEGIISFVDEVSDLTRLIGNGHFMIYYFELRSVWQISTLNEVELKQYRKECKGQLWLMKWM